LTLNFTHNTGVTPKSWLISFPRMGPMAAHDEVQRLDFEWNERKNPILGVIRARAKQMETVALEDGFLKKGWYDTSVVYEEEISEKEGWESHNVRLLRLYF
jgi:hypothetical protein